MTIARDHGTMRYTEHPAPVSLRAEIRFLWTLESDTTGSFPKRIMAGNMMYESDLARSSIAPKFGNNDEQH